MLAWILEYAGYAPGYLIGGVPLNFGISARLHGDKPSDFFVIEADEYDTAFFDKRSKFVHYHAKTAILNNLEFDHADIFPDVSAIETQFHHLVRTVPGIGRLIVNADEGTLQNVLQRGCWSEKEFFGKGGQGIEPEWRLCLQEGENFEVFYRDQSQGIVSWNLNGAHNRMNALAAIAAARHVGVAPQTAIDALAQFVNVKRRMELRGEVAGIKVIDDFAHHPTAISTTIEGLRRTVGEARILAVLEPRSNTMKLGAIKQALPGSLAAADLVFAYGALSGKDALGWDLAATLSPLGEKAQAHSDLSQLVESIVQQAKSGDSILVMSNGGFGGVHQRLLDALAQKHGVNCV
jgi:UDP-N-acetylmuramate: L-alanyl-gamma-D-glutamyl-meso-diaminopimelate ligase